MDKYNSSYYSSYNEYSEIERMLMADESIIWKGTPKKSAYVINASMKMAPFALIWLLFDGFFIVNFIGAGEMMGGMALVLIPFFALHLMPVWIWLFNMLTASKRWKNTEYAVTNKRVLIRNGLVGYQYDSIYYTDIANVSLRVGVIDKMLGVGDIYLSTKGGIIGAINSSRVNRSSIAPVILDVENPQEIFSMVQSTVMNIQTDIHYPNAYRPDNNPGYNTQYNPQYDMQEDNRYH